MADLDLSNVGIASIPHIAPCSTHQTREAGKAEQTNPAKIVVAVRVLTSRISRLIGSRLTRVHRLGQQG